MQTEKENRSDKQTKRRREAVTYRLLDPIEWGSEVIKELVFQPPKAKHIKTIKGDLSLGEILNIASKLTGVSTAALDEMSSSDAMEVSKIVGEVL